MDSISNMIIIIKNGSQARKKSVFLPYSKMKHAILECLKKEGYVGEIEKKLRNNQPVLEASLIYIDKKPKITEAERICR